MAYYASYAHAACDMLPCEAQIMPRTEATCPLTLDGMSQQELYALDYAGLPDAGFVGAFSHPYHAQQQIHSSPGYCEMALGDRFISCAGYANAFETQYYDAGHSPSGQFREHDRAFQTSSQPLALDVALITHASSAPPPPWPSPASDGAGASASPGSSQQTPPWSSPPPARAAERSFQCEVEGCGKRFTRSYNRKVHLHTHDVRREYRFPCDVDECGTVLCRKADLSRHHRSVHVKRRNHGCALCGRSFTRKDTLQRHTESGCPKRFDIETIYIDTTVP